MSQVTPIGNDRYEQQLPGLKRIFRLRTEDAWYGACATALEWCAERGHLTDREMHGALRTILDSYDGFSRFEREVIFTYATHKREA